MRYFCRKCLWRILTQSYLKRKHRVLVPDESPLSKRERPPPVISLIRIEASALSSLHCLKFLFDNWIKLN